MHKSRYTTPTPHVYIHAKISRTRDWLYGIRHTQPEASDDGPETQAEHLRIIYRLMTDPKHKGGAGITPQKGEWKHVKSLFPLHDNELNKRWIKDWSSKTFLSHADFDHIRARMGERVAFYFTFLQAYFAFLMVPAALGVVCWAILGQFSVVFSVVNSLACLVFVEYWKRQELDLALRWNVKGVSSIWSKRPEFVPQKEVVDQITGETVQVFPTTERLKRQLLQVPFALVSILALGTLIATCFAIEIFISEIYNGPFKTILVRISMGLDILYANLPGLYSYHSAVPARPNDNYRAHGRCDPAQRL